MSPVEPTDSRFEPALLLALIIMVGIALGKDVFYDIMSQAIAMIGLSVLVLALVMPLLGIAEMVVLKHTWKETSLAERLPEETSDCPPLECSRPLGPTPRPRPERNACSAGVRVLCGAIPRNDNKGWAG